MVLGRIVIALAGIAALAAMVGGGLALAQTGDEAVGDEVVEDDHGNTTEMASELVLGGSVSGEIEVAFDLDVFSLDLTGQSGETDLWLYTTEETDTLLFLLDSEDEPLLLNDDSFIAERRRSSAIRATVEPGEYFVAVAGFLFEVGEYTLHAQATEKPGGSRTTATVLGLDEPIPGRLDSSDDAGYFRFFVTRPTNLVIYALGMVMVDGNFELVPFAALEPTVTDSQGNELELNTYQWQIRTPGGIFPFGFQIEDGLERGHYYLKVSTPEDFELESSAPYTVHMYQDAAYDEFLSECEEARQESDKPGIDDALYACQWHLSNENDEDVNVEDAWEEGVLGEGVNVAIVDSGLYYLHEDLRDNVDTSRNHDYSGTGDVFLPYLHHGTLVAGIIAGRDNSVGVRGVAPRSTIYSYNLLHTNRVKSVDMADAMLRNFDVTAVSNNSWGPSDGPGLGLAPALWELAVEAGTSLGYEGEGVFYAFAAGNGHNRGDHSNLDELANFYAVTAVCAVNEAGERSLYSETGANLWVCAPSNDSREDEEGELLYRGTVTAEHYDRYSYDFGGTSSATPVVSGVAALMRSVNDDLSWRDLKLILAATARNSEPDNPGWETGAQKYMSDSEDDVYEFNEEYGFGVVDASAAVGAARDWTSVPRMRSGSVESGRLEASIQDPVESQDPDAPGVMLARELIGRELEAEIDFTEFVEVNVEIEHESFRDLYIWLESPSGTVSTLSTPFDTFNDFGPSEDHVALDGKIRFGSARHLGEDPNGEWQLGVVDYLGNGIEGKLVSFEITVYGHEPVPGVPLGVGVTELGRALRVNWTPPAEYEGPEVEYYDVRYIRTSEDASDDENWTLEYEAWTSDEGGELAYTIDGLTVGREYGVQVRAANRSDPGPWSETVTGTPWVRVFCQRGAVPAEEENPGLLSDCELLLRSRDALAGNATLNWEEDEAMSDWEGVTLSGTPERVTKLELQEKGLDGEIAVELSGVSELRLLYLHGNSLSGEIPAELGKLTNLRRLYLHENDLSGEIPTELDGLSELTHLVLINNELDGEIPESLGDLSNLVWLALYGNGLSGEIPATLGDLANLGTLYLHHNELSGEIPAELGNLSALTNLWLNNNQLSGEIPSSLGDLENLERWRLRNNSFTGCVPAGLAAVSDNDLASLGLEVCVGE